MNSPELVDEILAALGFDGEEEVTGNDGVTKKPIRLALISDYQIRAPHKEFLAAVAGRDEANSFLRDLLNPSIRTELDMYLHGREIIDVLLDSAKLGFEPNEFVQLLRKLQPRLVLDRVEPQGAPGAGPSNGGYSALRGARAAAARGVVHVPGRAGVRSPRASRFSCRCPSISARRRSRKCR